MEVTAEESIMKCYICSCECVTYKKLTRHYQKKHKEYDILLCPFCVFVTVKKTDMKNHKKAKHRQDKISCRHCDFSARSWKKWNNHQTSMHQDILSESRPSHRFQSHVDSQQIKSSSDSFLDLGHKKQTSHHPERNLYVQSEDKDHHTIHEKKKVSGITATAKIVKTPSSNVNLLNSSLCPPVSTERKSTMLTSNTSTIITSNSGKKTENVHCLDSVLQENSHHDTNSYICSKCDKTFSSSSSLNQHQKRHTRKKIYKCSICNFSSKYSNSLKSHEVLHADVSPYTCEFCDKSFSKKINLTYHLRVHNKDKLFHCPYCEYAADIKTTLEQHVRGHLGTKPYKCDICDYTTAYRSNLVYHATTHSVERPFPCEFCKKRFKRKDHLQNHVRCKHENTF